MNEDKSAIDLDNPEFQDVWKLISYTDRSVFMTGKAGTGKSTFLRYIVENTRKKTVVLAPTGIAAVNASGVTLHSFFHIPLKPLLPDDPELQMRNLRQRLRHSTDQQKLIRELELIVIDEVSMVRADIIDFIDKVLRLYSGRMREPFGGKQMLFVGDLYQLEPIVTSDMRDIFRDLYPNPYFFSARVFANFALVPIELRKVYRQNDSGFIAMLDRMRLGCSSQADIATLNERITDEETLKSKEFVVTLAPKRNTVDAINQQHLAKLRRKLYTFEGKLEGEFPENSLPAPMSLELKVGAQVVFVRNNPERLWVNGTVGKVHSISQNALEVELENGNIHTVPREIWQNIRYTLDKETHKIAEEVIGSFTQYPLRLAWAMTIHKSQGLTFSKVNIDMEGGAFAPGQAYVAMSRCRSLDGLSLRSKLNAYDFFVNGSIRRFSTQFNNPSLMQAAMKAARADDCFHRSAQAMNSSDFSQAVDLFIEGLYARDELRNPMCVRLVKQKLYRLGRQLQIIEELRGQLAQANEKFHRLAEEYVQMGLDCLQDENFGAAIANFDKAISIAPDFREARRYKAEAALDGGDPHSAEAIFSEMLEHNPRDFDALMGLSKAAMALAASDPSLADEYRYNALNYLMSAEEIEPESAPLHTRMADLYEQLDDREEAERHRAIARRLRRRSSRK